MECRQATVSGRSTVRGNSSSAGSIDVGYSMAISHRRSRSNRNRAIITYHSHSFCLNENAVIIIVFKPFNTFLAVNLADRRAVDRHNL